MKKITMLLVALCLAVPLFAWEEVDPYIGWFPAKSEQVQKDMDAQYRALSQERRDLVDQSKNEIFKKIEERLHQKDFSVPQEVADDLQMLSDYYANLKNYDKEVAQLFGAWLASYKFSAEGKDLGPLANVIMEVARKLQYDNFSQAEKLARFTRYIRKDYDSFL